MPRLLNFVPGWLFTWLLVLVFSATSHAAESSASQPRFSVIAFYDGAFEEAHTSFVHEANKWFAQTAAQHQFRYYATSNWNELNAAVLAQYKVVLFLDARPNVPAQRLVFKNYMEHGGAWMGFHFSGFALTPSKFPMDWDWYHNEFLGSGAYKGNTWPPVPAILRVEATNHPALKHLPATFKAAPNEWYSWSNDLKTNSQIKILLSIDPASFPLGTGPKPHEIWHEGYYPVVWSNQRYKMIYFNMGHNDITTEHGAIKDLSSSFSSETQNQLILDGLLWLGGVQP